MIAFGTYATFVFLETAELTMIRLETFCVFLTINSRTKNNRAGKHTAFVCQLYSGTRGLHAFCDALPIAIYHLIMDP